MSALRRLWSFALAALILVWAGIATAQMSPESREYYEEWLTVADSAEEVIDDGTASNVELENLRSEIAGYRELFIQSRTQNSARIRTLQAQLDALGPVPESGEEPPDIAELRGSLTGQLNNLQVPRIISEEAYNRANGLVGEIDRIIRARQTTKLFSRGPSPLNVDHWPEAARDVRDAIVTLWEETVLTATSAAAREQIRDHVGGILVLTVLGAALILRGAYWANELAEFLRGFGGRGTGVWRFVASLAKVALPLAGTIALVEALHLTGALGVRGTLFVDSFPAWAFTLLLFAWLSSQLFSTDGQGLVPSQPSRRTELRLYIELLAVMLILRDMIVLFEQIENVTDATRSVIGFPPVLISALLLIRVHRIQAKARQEVSDGDEKAKAGHVTRTIRRLAYTLGVVSPVLAALGYFYAAEGIIYPSVYTLVVVAIVLVLQNFIATIYGWISGKGEAAEDSLFSVLTGFILALLALPVLALIWGARVADLTELWTQFLEGIQFGDTRISPAGLVKFLFVFAIGYGATRLLQGGLRNSLLPKTRINPGVQNAVVSGTGYVGIFLAALVAVSAAGFDLSSLAIVAGALSVGIGFGLQTIVSNFVSGIILLIERPVSKGDWIEVGGLMGYVRDISVRSTRIETFDRTDVIIPNSDLISGTVTNFTRGNTIGRLIVPVGVAYGSETRRVEKVLFEIANAHPMVLANPAPSVVFQGFGADSLDFEIRAILRDVNWTLSVRSEINHEIARRFVEEGFEIPFAQRDIWLRNPEVLQGGNAFVGSSRHNFAEERPRAKDEYDNPETDDGGQPEDGDDH